MFFISSTTKEGKQMFMHLLRKMFVDAYKFHVDMTQPTMPNSVFVFGSNTLGLHYGGSALAALNHYGAEMGVGVGPTGDAWAVPTCIAPGGAEKCTIEMIQEHVNDLAEFAEYHDDHHFFITRLGCGVAGFTDAQIAPLFKGFPGNADFPIEWKEYL
jgi:hypothetical protein